MASDPYHTSCLPVHISCLVELTKSNDLFLLAHRLIDIYPESGVSWFAVGCYYLTIGCKSDYARRFLGKKFTQKNFKNCSEYLLIVLFFKVKQLR